MKVKLGKCSVVSITKNLGLFFALLLISCGHKEYIYYGTNENWGSIYVIPYQDYSEYIYNWHSIKRMDNERDTNAVFKVNLPLGISKVEGLGDELAVLYGRKKAIMIQTDYKSRNESPTFVQEEFNDSIFNLCPSFNLSDRQQRRIWPGNNKFTCKYLRRGNSRIYIFNFKEEESKKAIELIQNSFQFLPWDTVIVKTYEKK